MPSLEIELPPYVVPKRRGGDVVFYFQVPARLRPEGWPGALRLPLDASKRSGRGDAAELAAVVADGENLYRRLQGERSGLPAAARLHTLPWLIQSFEHHLKTTPREKPISQSTLDDYAYFGRVVIEWSAESGHPHVKTISRPAALEFLATMNDTPTKRKHVAGYLRQLMYHAMDKGVRPDNPFVKIKTETPKAKVHIWDDAELDKMVTTADELQLGAIATAMLIAHDEGPRPCDVLAFERKAETVSGRADLKTERGHYTPADGCFRYFQKKTDGWVVSPAGQRVRDRLARQPALQRPLVMNAHTLKAYNERVFLRDFHRVKEAAELPHLQFRHLRHTFCVKAKRAGLDAISIASKTGHDPKSVEDMLRKYYLPHDSEVAMNATAQLEAHRNRSRTP
jgi:site-specific recombinase XerD